MLTQHVVSITRDPKLATRLPTPYPMTAAWRDVSGLNTPLNIPDRSDLEIAEVIEVMIQETFHSTILEVFRSFGISFELKPMGEGYYESLLVKYTNARFRSVNKMTLQQLVADPSARAAIKPNELESLLDSEIQKELAKFVDHILAEYRCWGTRHLLKKIDKEWGAFMGSVIPAAQNTASVDASAIKARELDGYLIGRLDGYLMGSVIPAAQ